METLTPVILQYIMWLVGPSRSLCVNVCLYTLYRRVYPLCKIPSIWRRNHSTLSRQLHTHAGYVKSYYRFGIYNSKSYMVQIHDTLCVENGKVVIYPYNGVFRIYNERKGPQLTLDLNWEDYIFKFDSNKNAIVCNQEILYNKLNLLACADKYVFGYYFMYKKN